MPKTKGRLHLGAEEPCPDSCLADFETFAATLALAQVPADLIKAGRGRQQFEFAIERRDGSADIDLAVLAQHHALIGKLYAGLATLDAADAKDQRARDPRARARHRHRHRQGLRRSVRRHLADCQARHDCGKG